MNQSDKLNDAKQILSDLPPYALGADEKLLNEEECNSVYPARQFLRLSTAIHFNEVDEYTPYLIMKNHTDGSPTNKVWSYGGMFGQIRWCCVQEYAWNQAQMYVYFEKLPEITRAYIKQGFDDQRANLRRCDSDIWLRWATTNVNGNTPVLDFNFSCSTISDTSIEITSRIGERNFYVANSNDYLCLKDNVAGLYSLHKIVIGFYEIANILKQVWSYKIETSNFKSASTLYETIDDQLATQIYQDTLSVRPKYKDDIFVCVEFSLLYKAYAGLRASKSAHFYDYAVGIVWAQADKGHAANFFITPQGHIKIIEPQNGKIYNSPKEWVNSRGLQYVPTYMLI